MKPMGQKAQKEPVTLVSGSLEKGKAVLITSYDSGEVLWTLPVK